MTLDERMDFHGQILASIERNLGVLVEGQQRHEERLELLAKEFHEIPNVMALMSNSMATFVGSIASMTQVMTSLAGGVTTLAEGVTSQAQGVSQLVDITERNLTLLQDVVSRMEQLTGLQKMLDERQTMHEDQLNKLVGTLHEFFAAEKARAEHGKAEPGEEV